MTGWVKLRRGGAPAAKCIIAFLLAVPMAVAAPATPADDQIKLAHSLYGQKLYRTAIPEYERFLQNYATHPKAAEAALFLGHCCAKTEEWTKAAAAYRRALDAKPSEAIAGDARMGLAQVLAELGQWDKVVTVCADQIAKSKDKTQQAHAYYWLAESQFNRNLISQAEQNYRIVVEKYPDWEDAAYAQYSLGVCGATRGDPQAVINALTPMRDKYPKFGAMDQVRVMLGDAQRELGHFPEARQWYAPVTTGNGDTMVRFGALRGTAICAINMKDFPAALAAAEQAVALVKPGTPEYLDATLALANARYALKRYAEALEGYQQVAGGNSRDLAEEALYWAGNTLMVQGKNLEAVGQFQALLQRYEKSRLAASAQQHIGDCYAAAGKPVEAAAAYKIVLDRYPGTKQEQEARTALADLANHAAGTANADDLRKLAATLPPNLAGSVQVQLANKEFTAGRYQQAAEEAGKVLAGAPPADTAEEATYLLGASRFQLGDTQAAADAYTQIVTRYPQGKLISRALLELAWCQIELKKPAEAAKSARDLLARNPEGDLQVGALLALADASLANGDLQEAEGASQKALAANPKPEDALTALYTVALVAHRQKQFEEAVTRWQRVLEKSRAIEKSPVTGRASYYLGYALSQLKRYPEANTSLEQAAAAGGDMAEQARYELAWNYVETKEPERAAAEFERVAADFPNGALAARSLFLAGEQYFEKKEYPAAIERYKKAEALKPEGELAYSVPMRLGSALYEQKDYAGAAAPFGRAAAAAPEAKDAAEALYWAGQCHAQAGNKAQAGVLFGQCLEKGPADDLVAPACLGAANAALAQNDAARALTLCERGLATAQGDVAAEMNLRYGEALSKQGKHQEAARAFLKVAAGFAESPWAPEAQLKAGQAYEAAGEKATAMEIYRGVVERYGTTKAAEQAKARLAALGQ